MVRKRIAAGDAGLVSELVPGGQIIIYEHHVTMLRYGGATARIIMILSMEGLVIYAGEPTLGIASGLDQLRREDPDLGAVTESMKDARTPPEQRITVYADPEYAGLDGLYPGADVEYMEMNEMNPGRPKKARGPAGTGQKKAAEPGRTPVRRRRRAAAGGSGSRV